MNDLNHPKINKIKSEIFEIQKALFDAESKYPDHCVDIVHAVAIMSEEAGESVQAANDVKWSNGSIDHLKNELRQTAAACIRVLINMESI